MYLAHIQLYFAKIHLYLPKIQLNFVSNTNAFSQNIIEFSKHAASMQPKMTKFAPITIVVTRDTSVFALHKTLFVTRPLYLTKLQLFYGQNLTALSPPNKGVALDKTLIA